MEDSKRVYEDIETAEKAEGMTYDEMMDASMIKLSAKNNRVIVYDALEEIE